MTNRLPQPLRQRIAELSAKDQERLHQLLCRRARQGGIAGGDQTVFAIARMFNVDDGEVRQHYKAILRHWLGR